MDKINLDEILSQHIKEPLLASDDVKAAMMSFGEQLLELAVKKATIIDKEEWPFMPPINGDFKPTIVKVINTSSITDVIKLVEV